MGYLLLQALEQRRKAGRKGSTIQCLMSHDLELRENDGDEHTIEKQRTMSYDEGPALT